MKKITYVDNKIHIYRIVLNDQIVLIFMFFCFIVVGVFSTLLFVALAIQMLLKIRIYLVFSTLPYIKSNISEYGELSLV